MTATTAASPGRLAYFPISFFAMVMGLAGVTIAWAKAQHVLGLGVDLGLPLLVVTGTAFAGVVGL